MKIYVQFRQKEEVEVLKRAIGAVAELFNHVMVETLEDAEIMITDSSGIGLSLLKENEDATLVVFLAVDNREEHGALALVKNFPGRVEICSIFERPGAKVLMIYLMEKGVSGEDSSRG